MNSKIAFMQSYCSQVVKNIYYFNMWLCMKRKSEWGKMRDNNILYYFIGLYVKIKNKMQSEL